MKRLNIILKTVLSNILIIVLLTGCSESWLEPKPLSLYTPENLYTDAAGLYAALAASERHMRHEFFGNASPITTEMIMSDITVCGTTDKAGPAIDMDKALLPDAPRMNDTEGNRVGWYWTESYNAIKYANIVISRLNVATFKSEAERNAVLGAALCQRAYRYYKLVHQFGDVPFIDEEITSAKLDFMTHDRWSILKRIKTELEFAYKWVPEKADRGKTNKGTCGVVLMKVCMALGEFDRAIEVGNEIVAAFPLMTQRFSTAKNEPNTNLMFDIHSIEGKLFPGNTEGIMYGVSYPQVTGSQRIETMANSVPMWNNNAVKTPDGKTGCAEQPDASAKDTELDLNKKYGRGIARVRTTWYFSHEIWGEKEKQDLRGIYNRDSWKHPTDLKYNNPTLLKDKNPWYGKNMVKPVGMSVADSIRCWFDWPHYKVFVPDPLYSRWVGGETPWYIYRSAEVYLMLAECYYWKGNLGAAAQAMNPVRERAGALPLNAADITIGEILNERARELYYEENRHVEITRMAYTFAKTGKPCEVFNGHVYKLDNISGPGGVNSNIKEAGYNFWFDWVNAKNNFYNKGVKFVHAEYKISVHHILWPIPAANINANINGHINQNIGYPGAETNITPLEVPPADVSI